MADEPTGNLDTATGGSILDLLRGLHEGGTTIVVITHDPGVAAATDRRIEIRDGMIISDTPARVRDAGASRLTAADLLRVGSLGLRSRPVRAALSALGISIGIAAISGVLGIAQRPRPACWPSSASSATC